MCRESVSVHAELVQIHIIMPYSSFLAELNSSLLLVLSSDHRTTPGRPVKRIDYEAGMKSFRRERRQVKKIRPI